MSDAEDFQIEYENEDALPGPDVSLRSIFTQADEKGPYRLDLGRFPGLRLQSDVDAALGARDAEKREGAKAREKLRAWGDRTPEKFDELQAKVDELQGIIDAHDGGTFDEKKLEGLAATRAERLIGSKVNPLKREIETLKQELAEKDERIVKLTERDIRHDRGAALAPLAREFSIREEHREDVDLYAERHLERTEEGAFVVKEGVVFGGKPIQPGTSAKEWLREVVGARPGWRAQSKGGGAGGGGGGGPIPGLNGPNPWGPRPDWNVTRQGEILRDNPALAKRLAARFGFADASKAIHPPKPVQT